MTLKTQDTERRVVLFGAAAPDPDVVVGVVVVVGPDDDAAVGPNDDVAVGPDDDDVAVGPDDDDVAVGSDEDVAVGSDDDLAVPSGVRGCPLVVGRGGVIVDVVGVLVLGAIGNGATAANSWVCRLLFAGAAGVSTFVFLFGGVMRLMTHGSTRTLPPET